MDTVRLTFARECLSLVSIEALKRKLCRLKNLREKFISTVWTNHEGFRKTI